MKSKFYIDETAIVDQNVKIGDNTKIWHWTHISAGASIGKNCTIGQNCFVGKNVRIGNNCKIQNNVSIFEGVELANDIFIGPSVTFTNVKSPRSFINQKNKFNKTKIKKGCTIGANATIVCGINLDQYSFIGAGSVVTKSVKKNEIVFGNPAKIQGSVTKKGKKI
jgi:UDP-2-acetamido-3-amino-2,3-dideoxy-glucuronate N-acetyltransferase